MSKFEYKSNPSLPSAKRSMTLQEQVYRLWEPGMSKEKALINQVKLLARMYDELKGRIHATEVECTTFLNTGERLTRDGFEPYCHCSVGLESLDKDEHREAMRAERV